MPVYNAPLLQIDPKETRRYAGLMRAKDFDERLIEEACQDARLLAEPLRLRLRKPDRQSRSALPYRG